MRLWFKYISLRLAGNLEYRGWPFLLLQTLFIVVTDPLPMLLLYIRFGSLGEWSAERMLLVYFMAVTSFGLAELLLRGFDSFPWRIRSGSFDRILLRPRGIFLQVAANDFQLHRLPRPVTALAASIWMLARMGVRMGARELAIFFLAIAGGFAMYCGVFVLSSGMAFFTVKGLEWTSVLTNMSYQVVRVPEPYLPKGLKYLFSFVLPVLFVSFWPASAICGWGGGDILGWLALPAGGVFFLISLAVWRVGVRHYTGTGS